MSWGLGHIYYIIILPFIAHIYFTYAIFVVRYAIRQKYGPQKIYRRYSYNKTVDSNLVLSKKLPFFFVRIYKNVLISEYLNQRIQQQSLRLSELTYIRALPDVNKVFLVNEYSIF